ncbi:mitochondrial ribosomal subunit protein-domain-containing protein [Vararia minispora EC-137]|uniref:Mitochondrial ribosomal subunit protein-domain-containing protein n=1 Tax=Vararia minispora EC-137 TaxID=1314806 RepID=A0ACB8QP48_9AGAM|nr:mitochondrial ribosomal subunit protein-domain-containing protein [Vararia minispora EC-137]
MDDIKDFEYDDTTAIGHRYIEQQRRVLHYFRLIEHEMPNLVAFRQPFVPPTSETPVTVRSLNYGEEHPATAKRVIVAKVAHLPLRNKAAVHKFCVLAGVRWSPESPKDSGFRYKEEGGEHGYIKISCETFSEPSQNLKWASDTLDRLIREANNLEKDKLSDIPIDTRHLQAKIAKAGVGYRTPDFAVGGKTRRASPPSIKDFPPSWLPKLPPRTE